MERVVIDLKLSKLQSLINDNHITKDEYEAIESYTKEFRSTQLYKGLIAEVKVKQNEINDLFTKINKFKDEFENQKYAV